MTSVTSNGLPSAWQDRIGSLEAGKLADYVVLDKDYFTIPVEEIQKIKPQMTVMDFLMPELNGLEAARRLTKRNPDIPIVMITTDPSIQLEEEARQAGIKGVCAKDKMNCLASAIEIVMGGGTYFSKTFAA